MTSAFMNGGTPLHCQRCGRGYTQTSDDADMWNGNFTGGYMTGLVCPGCQTAEESVGAAVNEVELENSTTVDWQSLSSQEQSETILQAIYQRVDTVIKKHRDMALMAGKKHVEVDVLGWAIEAIDGWPGIVGQPEKARQSVINVAADEIAARLGIDYSQS